MGRSTGWLRGALAMACLLATGTAAAGTVRFDGEGHAENPVWSLDGRYIAFEVNRFAGNTDMFVAEISGAMARDAKKVRLPGGGGGFGAGSQVTINAAWHPEGMVVLEGSNQGGQFRLYYANPAVGTADEMLPTSMVPGDLTFPAVSPNGAKLAFVSDQTGNGDIRVFDRASGAVTQLTSTEGSEMFPEYDANGAQVLFTRKRNNTEAVYLLDTRTNEEVTVSSGTGDRTRPTFAGDRVVYFSHDGDGESWNLVSTDLRGQGRQTLASGVRLPVRGRPAVSPDGRWVAYVSADPTQSSKVVLVRADGSSRVEVPTEFVACGEPALTVANGRTLLAFTALPSADSAWRFLHVLDITGRI